MSLSSLILVRWRIWSGLAQEPNWTRDRSSRNSFGAGEGDWTYTRVPRLISGSAHVRAAFNQCTCFSIHRSDY